MSESIISGDIKLFQDNINWSDISFDSAGNPILDDGLENMVLISYGTNKRAENTDTLPTEHSDRQGWWGDSLNNINTQENKIGSKFWLRQKWKRGPDLLEQLQVDAIDALQHAITAGIVDEVLVTVTIDPYHKNRVLMKTELIKKGISVGYRYYYNWQNQTLSRE